MKLTSKRVVLDASAVLAYLNQEKGASVVANVLEKNQASISTVNYAETLSKMLDWKIPFEEASTALDALEMQVVDFDVRHAAATAAWREVTRTMGLSLGDRACLATAHLMQVPAMTADQVWQKIEQVKVILLR